MRAVFLEQKGGEVAERMTSCLAYAAGGKNEFSIIVSAFELFFIV
jgi:hypothetical protein